MGLTLPHEHITAGEWAITPKQRDSLRCLWGLLAPQLKRNGLCTLLDLTPADSCRDVLLMRDVARASGLNILCATGYYLAARRPANFISGGVEAAQAFMTRELKEGIGDTGVRAALMKIAVGGEPGNRSDDILLEAAARTQKQTGASISSHATTPEFRRHMLDELEKHGADLSRVAVGHADTNGTIDEGAQLLSRAGYLIYTIWGITNPRLIGSRTPVTADHSARLVRGLLDRGLVKKVMFSIDFAPVCLRSEGIDLSNHEIPDRTSDYLFTFVLPLLHKMNVSENEIRQMTVDNPRRHLFGV
jgi:phosphotriesterase-related protein